MTAAGRARFVVDASAEGQRLDLFVAHQLGVSAAGARRLIDAGEVRLLSGAAAKGRRLRAGEAVEIDAAAAARAAAPPAPVLPDPTIAALVIHEDPDLVAIDKPAGIPSHPLRAGERGTAANAIVARFPECAGASDDPREGGLGHRLDTPTSCVLLAARSPEVWRRLRAALGGPGCEKVYLAEVRGQPPDTGRIAADIGRAGRRGATVRTDGGRNPRPAETTFTVLARGETTALVEARLRAGRPHQVRAHLASAGFPIVGDDRYGPPSGAGATAPALRLHAAAVTFAHPTTNERVTVAAPPPAWAARGRFTCR